LDSNLSFVLEYGSETTIFVHHVQTTFLFLISQISILVVAAVQPMLLV